MSIPIIIGGTVIQFPVSGSSPNWAPALVEFAQAVEETLQAAVGDFDIPPQVFPLQNVVNTNLALPNLSFSPAEVRSATITFNVYRSTLSNVSFASGTITVMYNDDAGDWAFQREDDVGNVTDEVLFDITSTGQVRITTTALAGTDYSGRVGYYAKALKRE